MNQAQTDHVDRAAAYGDGAFESVAIRDGMARFWPDHVERLQTACLRLRLTPPTIATLDSTLEAALAATPDHAGFGTLRLVASAIASPRGYQRAGNGEISLHAQVFAARPVAPEQVQNGVAIRICKLRLAQQASLAGIKSLNRLEQVLARAEWNDPAIFEGLTLDTDDRLICGTMSNVFIVSENQLVTPGITRCGVAGIMRARVMRQLEQAGIRCDVRDIGGDELRDAAEVFLTNSQFGVLPVAQIDGQHFPVGALTRQTQHLMAANGVPECLA